MAIIKENLIFHTVTLENNAYKVLDPKTIEELIYGIENDLLTFNEHTKVNKSSVIIKMQDFYISLS